jgi:hypothetical protein
VRNDAARLAQLIDQIRTYRETVFSRETQQTLLKPMIDQMEAILLGLVCPMLYHRLRQCGSNCGWPNRPVISVPGCLAPARSIFSRMTPVNACMPAMPRRFRRVHPIRLRFEVIHRSLPDDNDNSDLWCFNDLGTGKSVTSQAFGRFLHASTTLTTGEGHKYLYTCAGKQCRSSRRILDYSL